MKQSVIEKLSTLKERHAEISGLLSQPGVTDNMENYRKLRCEHAHLDPIVRCLDKYQQVSLSLAQAKELAVGDDKDLKPIAQEEIPILDGQIAALETELKGLMIPKDRHDHSSVFLEIRAGTGGDEAAIFAGDLLKMYCRYAEEKQLWKTEIISSKECEHGGFKEIIIKISGENVWARLKFESGGHRVQRVPATESQGRVHTSAATVAVLPEADEIDRIEVNPSDLRIDTFRASGAGGQHVNKTDSAIRITHIPSGLVVECQDERSQHRNKNRAMALLSARLLDTERRRQERKQSENRRNLIGSGDRSQKIRTYNFSQGRVTDHRINLTLYKLPQILEGDLDPLIDNLINEHRADLLAAVESENI